MNGAAGAYRQAVYTALQPFLPPAALHEAVDYWEQHFARSTGGTLHRFVTQVCQHTGLDDQRAEMLTALTAEMSRAGQPGYSSGSGPEPQATEGHLGAFEHLLDRMLTGIDPLSSEQLRTDLVVSLRRDRFSGVFLTRLRGWILNGQPLRPVAVPVPALRATVNQLYVLMAERIGPVETDRTLHQAIHALREQHTDLADAVAALV